MKHYETLWKPDNIAIYQPLQDSMDFIHPQYDENTWNDNNDKRTTKASFWLLLLLLADSPQSLVWKQMTPELRPTPPPRQPRCVITLGFRVRWMSTTRQPTAGHATDITVASFQRAWDNSLAKPWVFTWIKMKKCFVLSWPTDNGSGFHLHPSHSSGIGHCNFWTLLQDSIRIHSWKNTTIFGHKSPE